jgi:hypothetical protein
MAFHMQILKADYVGDIFQLIYIFYKKDVQHITWCEAKGITKLITLHTGKYLPIFLQFYIIIQNHMIKLAITLLHVHKFYLTGKITVLQLNSFFVLYQGQNSVLNITKFLALNPN